MCDSHVPLTTQLKLARQFQFEAEYWASMATERRELYINNLHRSQMYKTHFRFVRAISAQESSASNSKKARQLQGIEP